MKKFGLLALTAAMILGTCLGGSWAWADSPGKIKPAAVVAFSGYNEVKADLAYIGKLSDNPGLGDAVEVLFKIFVLKNRSLDGLDKDRPWGVILQLDEEKFAQGVSKPEDAMRGYAFVPVTNLESLLENLEPLVGAAQEASPGVYELNKGFRRSSEKPRRESKAARKGKRETTESDAEKPARIGKSVYVKAVSGWAFLADRPELLAKTPEKPDQLLAGLAAKYDFATRFYLSSVPKEVRDHLLAEMQRQAEADLARQKERVSEEEYAVRKIFAERLLRDVRTGLEDLDTVTLGWALDHKEGRTYLDLSVTAKPGTKTARQYARLSDTQSKCTGFALPGATLTGNWAGQFSETESADLLSVVELVRKKALADIEKQPAEKAAVAAKLLNGTLDVIRATIAKGRVDGGMVALLDPQAVTVAVGGFVAEGEKLDATLKQLVDAIVQEHPEAAGLVDWEAGEHKGMKFHSASIPIPPDAKDREKVVAMIGETLEIVVGIGKESAAIALGRKPLETLKQVIDQSEKAGSTEVPPLRISLDLGALTKFAAVVSDKEEERQKMAVAAALLEKAGEEDRVNLVASPIDNGVQLRVEVEQGILKAIGAATQQGGQ